MPSMFFGIFPAGEEYLSEASTSSEEYSVTVVEVSKITTNKNTLTRMPFVLARIRMDIILNV